MRQPYRDLRVEQVSGTHTPTFQLPKILDAIKSTGLPDAIVESIWVEIDGQVTVTNLEPTFHAHQWPQLITDVELKIGPSWTPFVGVHGESIWAYHLRNLGVAAQYVLRNIDGANTLAGRHEIAGDGVAKDLHFLFPLWFAHSKGNRFRQRDDGLHPLLCQQGSLSFTVKALDDVAIGAVNTFSYTLWVRIRPTRKLEFGRRIRIHELPLAANYSASIEAGARLDGMWIAPYPIDGGGLLLRRDHAADAADYGTDLVTRYPNIKSDALEINYNGNTPAEQQQDISILSGNYQDFHPRTPDYFGRFFYYDLTYHDAVIRRVDTMEFERGGLIALQLVGTNPTAGDTVIMVFDEAWRADELALMQDRPGDQIGAKESVLLAGRLAGSSASVAKTTVSQGLPASELRISGPIKLDYNEAKA